MTNSVSKKFSCSSISQERQHQKRQQQMKLKQPNFEIKPSMDLCNLYITGIQPGFTSTELFNIFSPYGRIISARVMEGSSNNSPNTGFGFVSYSTSLEAARALVDMYSEQKQKANNANKKIASTKNIDNNSLLKTAMTVRFHEPRIPRPEHNFDYQLSLLSSSELGAHFYISQNDKMVSLYAIEDKSPTLVAINSYSPNAAAPSSYFPAMMNQDYINTLNSNCYYYPPFWTDQYGNLYTNLVTQPIPQPNNYISAYYTHINSHQQPLAKNGNILEAPNDNIAFNIKEKLVELVKSDQNIASEEKCKVINQFINLDYAEQSKCIDDAAYFKGKVMVLLKKDIGSKQSK